MGSCAAGTGALLDLQDLKDDFATRGLNCRLVSHTFADQCLTNRAAVADAPARWVCFDRANNGIGLLKVGACFTHNNGGAESDFALRLALFVNELSVLE